MASALFQRLLARLDLQEVSADCFVGGSGSGGVTVENRLYGGLVLAQAVVAACRTSSLAMHSLHAYFVRPGRPDTDIRFEVERLKSGRRYDIRALRGVQQDKVIFHMSASFSADAEDVTHQHEAPEAPAPEALLNRDQARGRKNWQDQPIDVRLCDELAKDQPLPARKSVWIRPQAEPPDDPIVHRALLAYATDRAFLSTAWRPHADQGEQRGASLDHAVWFHDPVRFDDWLLYESVSPVLRHQRGLVQGAIFTRSGRLVATTAQEGQVASGRDRR